MDWGGHVHPTSLRIDFLSRRNSIFKVGGRGCVFLLRDQYSFPSVYSSVISRRTNHMGFHFLDLFYIRKKVLLG